MAEKRKGKNTKGSGSSRKAGNSSAGRTGKKTGRTGSRSAKSRTGNKGRAAADRTNRNTGLYDEIAGIIMLVTGVFLCISMHTHLAGAAGELIGTFLRGMFGLAGYILPYLMIIYSISVFMKVCRPFSLGTGAAMAVTFLMITLINSGRFLKSFSLENASVAGVYRAGNSLEGGGVAGMYAGKVVETAIGPAGLYLMSVTVILITVLITFRTPLSDFWADMSERRTEKKDRKEKKIKQEKADYLSGRREEAIIDYLRDDEAGGYDRNTDDMQRAARMREKLAENRNRKNILSLLRSGFGDGGENGEAAGEQPVAADGSEKIRSDVSYAQDTGSQMVWDTSRAAGTDAAHEKRQVDFVSRGADGKSEKKEDPYENRSFMASMEKKKVGDFIEEKAEKSVRKQDVSGYVMPGPDLLRMPAKTGRSREDAGKLEESARLLEDTLKSFGVDAKVINVTKGSSVTRYEIQPAIGTKVASIVRLSDDIALNLRARSIRIEAPIPGKAAVGIEIENEKRETVTAGEMILSDEFRRHPSKLAFAVGKDISGRPVVADLGRMPHMLIAGATGSGKSVCINTIIASILYKARPDEVKLLLIDPKMVELGNYNGIPHLLIPVVTDPGKAAAALNWAVAEMTSRYKKFAENGVREIKGYNALMEKKGRSEDVLPKIVIIIDELADLMMVASSQVEEAICRLAQLARAAGMHLIVATQRPSVDVVTGLIKANIPSRIAFMVSSQIDSRTIIDMPGAEKLVGNGDMLFKPQDLDKPLRIQGPFISDDEVAALIEFIKGQNTETEYDEDIIETVEKKEKSGAGEDTDELMDEAVETVVRAGQASVSMLQRRFRIGYNRAARIIDDMEARGIVGPQDGSRPRTVLMTPEELLSGNTGADNKSDESEVKKDRTEEMQTEMFVSDNKEEI